MDCVRTERGKPCSHLLLVYEPHRRVDYAYVRDLPKDPVFISGQGLGAVVYLRNLVLISRADQTKANPGPSHDRLETQTAVSAPSITH